MIYNLYLRQLLCPLLYGNIIDSVIRQIPICRPKLLNLIVSGGNSSDCDRTVGSCCYGRIRQWCILSKTEDIEGSPCNPLSINIHFFNHNTGFLCVFNRYSAGLSAFCIYLIHLIRRNISICRGNLCNFIPAFFYIWQRNATVLIRYTYIYLSGILICDFKVYPCNGFWCFCINLLNLYRWLFLIFHDNNCFLAPVNLTNLRCGIQNIIKSGRKLLNLIAAFGQVFNRYFAILTSFYYLFKACSMIDDLKIKTC